jgi:hypothetical protein
VTTQVKENVLPCEVCGQEFTGQARWANLGSHKKHKHGAVLSQVQPIIVKKEDLPTPHDTPVLTALKHPAVWFPFFALMPMGILGVIAGTGMGTNMLSFCVALAVPPFMVWSNHIRHLREFVYYEVDKNTQVKSRVVHWVHMNEVRALIEKHPQTREAYWSGDKQSFEFVVTEEGIAVFQPLNASRPYATPRMLYSITVQDDVEKVNKTPDRAAVTRRNISLGAIAIAYGAAFFLVQEIMPKVAAVGVQP